MKTKTEASVEKGDQGSKLSLFGETVCLLGWHERASTEAFIHQNVFG